MPNRHKMHIVVAVVAHIDHGKTSLIDSLIAAAGRIPPSVAGQIRYLDTRSDEVARGITLKLSAIKLEYQCVTNKLSTNNLNESPHNRFLGVKSAGTTSCDNPQSKNIASFYRETPDTGVYSVRSGFSNQKMYSEVNADSSTGDKHIFYVIDTPGHVDFESLVISAALMTTNAALLIDASEGVTPRALSIVRHIRSKKCILILNKLDRLAGRGLAHRLAALIVQVNALFKCDKFVWEDNTIVLASATQCTGINYQGMKDVFGSGKKTSLRAAAEFWEYIHARIQDGNTAGLKMKLRVDCNDDRDIYKSAFPLHKAFYSSVISASVQPRDFANDFFASSAFQLGEIHQSSDTRNGFLQNDSRITTSFETGQNTATVEHFGHVSTYEQSPTVELDDDLEYQDDQHGNSSNTNKYTENMDVNCISAFTSLKNQQNVQNYDQETSVHTKFSEYRKDTKYESMNTNISHQNAGKGFLAVVGFATFRQKHLYTPENIIFAISVKSGTIMKGDTVYCISKDRCEHVVINSIFECYGDSFEESQQCSKDQLVYIQANLMKNSILASRKIENFAWPIVMNPFYKKHLTVTDELSTKMKNSLKVLAYTEPLLKAKINQFGEYEILCEGQVQFEKICNDLKAMGNDFQVFDTPELWAECCGKANRYSQKNSHYEIDVTIEPIDIGDFSISQHGNGASKDQNGDIQSDLAVFSAPSSNSGCTETDQPINTDIKVQNVNNGTIKSDPTVSNSQQLCVTTIGAVKSSVNQTEGELYDKDVAKEALIIETWELKQNMIKIELRNHKNVVKNSINTFINSGLLIQSNIMFTKITLKFLEHQKNTHDEVFKTVKDALKECFTGSAPQIMPFYYKSRSSLLGSYIGVVYTTLGKYKHIFIDEQYDPETEFHIITSLIPQFLYYNFLEESRMQTSGTIYVQIENFGFYRRDSFGGHVDSLRRSKGLQIDEVVVSDPNKQRTRKK